MATIHNVRVRMSSSTLLRQRPIALNPKFPPTPCPQLSGWASRRDDPPPQGVPGPGQPHPCSPASELAGKAGPSQHATAPLWRHAIHAAGASVLAAAPSCMPGWSRGRKGSLSGHRLLTASGAPFDFPNRTLTRACSARAGIAAPSAIRRRGEFCWSCWSRLRASSRLMRRTPGRCLLRTWDRRRTRRLGGQRRSLCQLMRG